MKAHLAWKQLKEDSKNIWKEENCRHDFVCLLVGYISVKKIIENCNSVGAGAHKLGKVVSFWHNFDPSFLIFGEHEKSKLYILKKVGLSTFEEILQKHVYNSTFMFFKIFLFCLKGYSETLTQDLSIPIFQRRTTQNSSFLPPFIFPCHFVFIFWHFYIKNKLKGKVKGSVFVLSKLSS